MLVKCIQRCITVANRVHAGIPDQQQVVVTTTSKVLPVRRPLQSTHFLGMSGKSSDMMVCYTNIVMMNSSTSAATKNKLIGKFCWLSLLMIWTTFPGHCTQIQQAEHLACTADENTILIVFLFPKCLNNFNL